MATVHGLQRVRPNRALMQRANICRLSIVTWLKDRLHLKDSRIQHPKICLWPKGYFELLILRNSRQHRKQSTNRVRSHPSSEIYINFLKKSLFVWCLHLHSRRKRQTLNHIINREGTHLNLHNKSQACSPVFPGHLPSQTPHTFFSFVFG